MVLTIVSRCNMHRIIKDQILICSIYAVCETVHLHLSVVLFTFEIHENGHPLIFTSWYLYKLINDSQFPKIAA